MQTAPGLSARLRPILCLVLCQIIGHASTDLYNLATPQLDDGTTLTSCVFVLDTIDFLDPVTGLIDEISIPAGSLLSSSYSTQCDSTYTGTFVLDLQPDTQTSRVHLSDTDSNLYDAFLPLPTQCLGTEYVVATWNPGGTAFVAMYNPNADIISVDISLGPSTDPSAVLVDGVVATQTHGITLQISSGDIKYVTSSSQALDGLSVSATNNVGILAGNTDAQVFGFGLASNFLEMFPPTDSFSDEYVVPLPPNAVHCVLKVVSLSRDAEVEVTLTDLLEGSPSTSTRSNTLTVLGDVWSVTHSNTLLVQANGPVMAIQFNPEENHKETTKYQNVWKRMGVMKETEAVLDDLDDSDSIRNPFTDSSSGEWEPNSTDDEDSELSDEEKSNSFPVDQPVSDSCSSTGSASPQYPMLSTSNTEAPPIDIQPQFKKWTSLFDASSMTLIPPTSKWVWSAVLYPLTSSVSGLDEHLVIINIKTIHVNGLFIYNLYDGSYLKSSITFTQFDQSDYSHAEVTLDASTIILIQHLDHQTFQVVQYGSSSDVNGLYSFPAAWNTSCQQTMIASSSSTTPHTTTELREDSSNSSSSESTSNTDLFSSENFFYVVVSGAVFVAAMAVIVGVVCFYFKNKHTQNGDIVLEIKSNHNKSNAYPNSGDAVVFDKGDNRVIDTAKRRNIELPRVVHVKPVEKLN